ncbi:hypothetical protein F4777DRAFT_584015 [Nemania sp. FL0916]|nr:hypothetical protein F4777DRAFT_584015 [Nemania sp. FL0916]
MSEPGSNYSTASSASSSSAASSAPAASAASAASSAWAPRADSTAATIRWSYPEFENLPIKVQNMIWVYYFLALSAPRIHVIELDPSFPSEAPKGHPYPAPPNKILRSMHATVDPSTGRCRIHEDPEPSTTEHTSVQGVNHLSKCSYSDIKAMADVAWEQDLIYLTGEYSEIALWTITQSAMGLRLSHIAIEIPTEDPVTWEPYIVDVSEWCSVKQWFKRQRQFIRSILLVQENPRLRVFDNLQYSLDEWRFAHLLYSDYDPTFAQSFWEFVRAFPEVSFKMVVNINWRCAGMSALMIRRLRRWIDNRADWYN